MSENEQGCAFVAIKKSCIRINLCQVASEIRRLNMKIPNRRSCERSDEPGIARAIWRSRSLRLTGAAVSGHGRGIRLLTAGDFHLAEDAAQEAFLSAFRELSKLREIEAFPGWFRQIVFTRCTRLKRKDSRFQVVSLDAAGDLSAPLSRPSETLERKERREIVHRALEALPERYAEVTTLFYISDYSQKEIARFLDLPLTTVEKRLQYARQRLKKGICAMMKRNLQAGRASRDQAFSSTVMEKLTVRKADEADVMAVGHLMREGVNLQPGRTWPYADSADYIGNVVRNDPEGCFLGRVGDQPVGHIQTHVTGSVGFIGSVGVDRAHRGRGYGKTLVEVAVKHLQARCSVVGVAVPSAARAALNLFYNAGFRETLPARQIEWGHRTAGNPSSVSRRLRLGAQLHSDSFESVIADIRTWTDRIYSGLDFSNDIRFFLNTYPESILFYFENGRPRGFLAVHDDYLGAEVWGAVEPGEKDGKVMEALVREKTLFDSGGMFRFNTFCRRVTDVFLRCGGRILDDMTCMMLPPNRNAWLDQVSQALLLQCWTSA